MGAVEEFVHRHVLGSTEFDNYLDLRRSDSRVRGYGTIYLAFHGTDRGLLVGDRPLSLDVLAEMLGDLPGAVVHLGSCSALRGNTDAARRFLRATGARMISGYERDVEWLDSATLDTAWLGHVASYVQVGRAERTFRKRYASVIDHLRWDAISPAR
jgi:hypothetical protein